MRLVLGVVALSTAAAGSQGLSVGILGYFADTVVQAESGRGPTDGSFPSDEVSLVVLLAGSLFVALIGNSLLAWGAARLGRRLGRNYHERVGRTVLTSFSHYQTGTTNIQPRAVTMLVMRSSRILGRSVEALLGSVRLVFQALVAASIVIATEPALSLVVAPLLLMVAPFVYKVGGRIRESSKEFYDSSFQSTAARVRALVSGVDEVQLRDRQPGFVAGFGRDETTARYFDLFDDILLAGPRTVLVTSAFRSFLLVLVVSVAGYSVVKGAFSWGSLTIYVTALGYLLNNIQGLAETVTKLNRFFPQLDEYQKFLGLTDTAPPESSDLPRRFELQLLGQDPLPLSPGSCVAYAPRKRLGRLTVNEALSPLALASGASPDSWAALPFVLGNLILFEQAPPHPWTDRSQAGTSEEQPNRDRVAAALSTLHQLDSPVALIGSEVLAQADRALRTRILDAFADRIVVIVLGARWPEDLDLSVVLETNNGQLECVDLARFREIRAADPETFLPDEEDDDE